MTGGNRHGSGNLNLQAVAETLSKDWGFGFSRGVPLAFHPPSDLRLATSELRPPCLEPLGRSFELRHRSSEVGGATSKLRYSSKNLRYRSSELGHRSSEPRRRSSEVGGGTSEVGPPTSEVGTPTSEVGGSGPSGQGNP